MAEISVLIVSQQTLLQRGIQHSLCGTGRVHTVTSARTDEDVLSRIDPEPPDVAIIDIDGPGEQGMRVAARIRQRSANVGVILLTANPSDEQVFQALRIQAAACLGKEISAGDLMDVVERVARREHPINEAMATRPAVARQVLSQFQRLSLHDDGQDITSPVTPREKEILQHIANGYLNKQIAAELSISEQTIKNHVTSILRKLNANARTEAVVLAIKRGLISISTPSSDSPQESRTATEPPHGGTSSPARPEDAVALQRSRNP